MSKRKKILKEIDIPQFEEGLKDMPEDSKIFVDKSLEIVDYINKIMDEKELKQKDVATKMGKSEAELSKILSGMHNLTLRTISKLEAALGTAIICTPQTINIKFPNIENHNNRIVIREFVNSDIDQHFSGQHHYSDFEVYKSAASMENSSCSLIKIMEYNKSGMSFDKVKKKSENQVAKAS